MNEELKDDSGILVYRGEENNNYAIYDFFTKYINNKAIICVVDDKYIFNPDVSHHGIITNNYKGKIIKTDYIYVYPYISSNDKLDKEVNRKREDLLYVDMYFQEYEKTVQDKDNKKTVFDKMHSYQFEYLIYALDECKRAADTLNKPIRIDAMISVFSDKSEHKIIVYPFTEDLRNSKDDRITDIETVKQEFSRCLSKKLEEEKRNNVVAENNNKIHLFDGISKLFKNNSKTKQR